MRIRVIGIGADGWSGMPETVRDQVSGADVLIGAPRHLASIPAIGGQERHLWPSPLRPALENGWLEAFADRSVVAIASGDPLVAGIGTTLIDLLGVENVEVSPAVSSVALARARLGWPAETVTVVRDHRELVRHLAPGERIIVLSADETTPAAVAALVTEHGWGASRLAVLANLGADDESSLIGTAGRWGAPDVPRLNLVAVQIEGDVRGSWTPGLPDDAFENDGQITKRDLRASALARLVPTPGQLLWDVGAGAGSVAIEWMRREPRCTAIAIESDDVRADRIVRNAVHLGTPGLTVVHGTAPEALVDLPPPDAIFIGGGATRPGVVDACLAALKPGGRLVVHGVTAQTESLLLDLYGGHGGELTRMRIERAEPLGGFTGWTPARTVTQWTVTR